jgi:hypothetical protein
MDRMGHEAIAGRHGRNVTNAPPQDHDLPVLAREQNPIVSLDWDVLIAAGVQPALVLGAERRWQGRR